MKVQIHFGAMCKPLKDQAAEQGFEIIDVSFFQAHADRITYLKVARFLTEAEAKRARDRLMKRLVLNCVEKEVTP